MLIVLSLSYFIVWVNFFKFEGLPWNRSWKVNWRYVGSWHNPAVHIADNATHELPVNGEHRPFGLCCGAGQKITRCGLHTNQPDMLQGSMRGYSQQPC